MFFYSTRVSSHIHYLTKMKIGMDNDREFEGLCHFLEKKGYSAKEVALGFLTLLMEDGGLGFSQMENVLADLGRRKLASVARVEEIAVGLTKLVNQSQRLTFDFLKRAIDSNEAAGDVLRKASGQPPEG